MKGSSKITFLFIFLLLVSGILYFGYKDYQKFQKSQTLVTTLQPIDSTYRALRNFTPGLPADIEPIKTIQEDAVVYISPLSPCVSLIHDRNWDIYSSQRRLFQGSDQMMLFDRFWNVAWLGLKPKRSEIIDFRFYGPFRIDNVPERSFVEYLLLGRDITQSNGSFAISIFKDSCER